jgi:hypothetical protein
LTWPTLFSYWILRCSCDDVDGAKADWTMQELYGPLIIIASQDGVEYAMGPKWCCKCCRNRNDAAKKRAKDLAGQQTLGTIGMLLLQEANALVRLLASPQRLLWTW